MSHKDFIYNAVFSEILNKGFASDIASVCARDSVTFWEKSSGMPGGVMKNLLIQARKQAKMLKGKTP